jgi:hypothetical protein
MTKPDTFIMDATLYPDQEPPRPPLSLDQRIDFLARLCAAWDFGLLPRRDVVAEVRRRAWREAVDKCQLVTSPAYHLLREWHHLPKLPYIGQRLAYIADDPSLQHV